MNIYIVQKGDTLYSIAKKFGTTVSQLAEQNQLSNVDRLVVGQSLVITSMPKPIIEVNGYSYTNIDNSTLLKTLPNLTYLSIFSYKFTEEGELIPVSDENLINIANNNGVFPLLVLTNIGSDGKFDSNLAHTILFEKKVQKKLISSLIALLKKKNYKGLNIDFEYLYPSDKDLYNSFIEEVSNMLKEENLIMITALAPKVRDNQSGMLYEAHDYSAHGKFSDRVILMTYEWGYTYGPPMAVAPINQVERVIKYASSVIPSKKILIGIPNYGYDWTLPYQAGTPAKSISNVAAIQLAVQTGSEIQFDPVAKVPYFYYKGNDQKLHVVWFEDARSIQEKLLLVNKYQLGGISYWTIKDYFSQGFLVLNNYYRIRKK